MKVNHGKIVYILFLLMILFLIIPVSFASNETVNPTDSNGKLYFSINLNPGVYDITLTNLNDGFSKINKVTVLSTIQGNNLVKYYKNESQFYATILNGTGHYATHTPIEINIHGVIYTKVTDSTGKAKMNINLNPGIYILTVKNTLDGLQMSYTVEVLSTIIGSTFTKFKSEAKAFTVTILNGVGNPLNGATVSFNINGVFYSRTTNSNGIASLNINLQTGSYINTASFNGLNMGYNIYVYHDMVHNETNPLLIPVQKYIQKNDWYSIKLTENNGLPMSGKSITIKINPGTYTYTATTNRDGIANFRLNLNPGTYNITASYNNVKKSRIMHISSANNGLETVITPLTTAVKKGDYFQVKLTNKNNGAVLSGQNIIFYANGIEYTKTTDENGIASLKIGYEKSDICPVTASYEGTTSGTIYKPSTTYKLFYKINSLTDPDYITYPGSGCIYLFIKEDWVNPTDYLISANLPTNNIIACTDNDYIITLSNYLTGYNDLLENVVSINSYVSSINYKYYINHQISALNVLLNFNGNCVDQTNVFVSLARIAGYPTRYVDLSPKTGTVGHQIGQILIDDTWITVDNSATNQNYINLPGSRLLGNKEYLNQQFTTNGYIHTIYENNNGYGFKPQ